MARDPFLLSVGLGGFYALPIARLAVSAVLARLGEPRNPFACWVCRSLSLVGSSVTTATVWFFVRQLAWKCSALAAKRLFVGILDLEMLTGVSGGGKHSYGVGMAMVTALMGQ